MQPASSRPSYHWKCVLQATAHATNVSNAAKPISQKHDDKIPLALTNYVGVELGEFCPILAGEGPEIPGHDASGLTNAKGQPYDFATLFNRWLATKCGCTGDRTPHAQGSCQASKGQPLVAGKGP